MKKHILLFVSLMLVGCSSKKTVYPEVPADEPPAEESEKIEESSEEITSEEPLEESSEESKEEGWSKEKCEENAEQHPAKPGAVLVTKGNHNFTGMPYYFKGTLEGVDIVSEFDGKTVWLVRNENGYAIPVEMPDGENAELGSEVEIWGTLSGEGYTIESVENVVGEVGYLIMMQYSVNGEPVI